MAQKTKQQSKDKAKSDTEASKQSEKSEHNVMGPNIFDQWQDTTAQPDDPLLGCLEIICSMKDRPMSTTSLKAGLPLVNDLLTPELFTRAASRAGLNAKIVRKQLSHISKFTLPCVLLLQGNKACILVSVDDQEAEVIFPEMGRGIRKILLDDLKKIYVGITLFVTALYQYDTRSSDIAVKRPKSWFWGTLMEFWPIYSQVALAAILVNIFAIASPLFTMNVYDRVVPNNATETLWVLAIGVGIVFLFDLLLRTLRGYFVDSAGKNADIILASRLFEQVMGIQMASRPQSSGSFANQLREFETLREFFSSMTLVALIDLPFVFLFISVIWMIGGPIAYVPLIAVPIVMTASFLLQFPLRSWVRKTFREGAQKHALLVEAINGMETIKSLGVEGKIQKNWENFVSQSAGSSNATRFISMGAINFTTFIINLSTVSVIIVGVYLITKNELTMGGLIACSILSGRTLAPLAQVVSLLTRFSQSMTALKALDQIIQMPVERPENATFLHRPKFQGKIEFKNVSFRYPDQKISALNDVSFTIEPGEKVGVIGRIGSGKTTIEKMILGLYFPEEGSVLIDGADTRQLDPAELRASIGYIPQDIFLFFGSVRDNIAMGTGEVDDAAILRAATIAGVDNFVRRHPQGYDLPVGEGGRNVSGGQRQSIAVARALVRDPSILLFDEPTAMMDHAAEMRFVARLKDALGHKTMILVTHKMSLLTHVNRLIVTDDGKIVADGPRDDVLKALSGSQINSAG
ncbi:MAG: type I secretion system permease/ATPase [Pseudomonadota bacterium]